MKILCEDNLVYAKEFLSDIAQPEYFSGATVTPEDLKNVEYLLLRSTTQVTEQLLADANKLKWIATATAGTNHISFDALDKRKIEAYSAAGCNAVAVAEYVIAAILFMGQARRFDLRNKQVGIVGFGNTGSRVAKRLQALGVETRHYDPPLAENAESGESDEFHSFEEIMDCDIVTLHVPLIEKGTHQTKHLLNEERLAELQDEQILINACRGEVVDNQALLQLKKDGRDFGLVMDVWENEPEICTELIPYCDLATAHIAGHSIEGKARGTEMVYQALCRKLNKPAPKSIQDFLPAPNTTEYDYQGDEISPLGLHQLVRCVYDIEADSRHFKNNTKSAADFRYIRKHYGIRREFGSLQVNTGNLSDSQAIYGLGFKVN